MRTNKEIISLMDNLRQDKGMSISELARRVHMAKSAVSRYFNQTREFPLNKINIFATVLEVTPAFLLGFVESEIDQKYNKLDDERKEQVYNFLINQLHEQQESNEQKASNLPDFFAKKNIAHARAYIKSVDTKTLTPFERKKLAAEHLSDEDALALANELKRNERSTKDDIKKT
jgi:transcriptional regulator with XRE-family HTH domain